MSDLHSCSPRTGLYTDIRETLAAWTLSDTILTRNLYINTSSNNLSLPSSQLGDSNCKADTKKY